MKSTKTLLITGIALAIALFASIQITAMEPQVNPYLTNKQKEYLEEAIGKINNTKDTMSYVLSGEIQMSPRAIKMLQEKLEKDEPILEHMKKIYYGNQAYTGDETQMKVAAQVKSATQMEQTTQSVQVVAMESGRTVNPYLKGGQKRFLNTIAANAKNVIENNTEMLSFTKSPAAIKVLKEKIQAATQELNNINKVYYDNEVYTDQEMFKILYPENINVINSMEWYHKFSYININLKKRCFS